jgi:hypothetical protein
MFGALFALLMVLFASGCASPAEGRWASSPAGKRGDTLSAGRVQMESESTGSAAPADYDGPPAPPSPVTTLVPAREPSPVAAKSAPFQGPKPVGTPSAQTPSTQSTQTASNAAQAQQSAPHVVDMLIYTASLTMAVYQVTPGLEAVERIAREVGGYLSQRSDVAITIRVPRARFDDALHRIEASGDVLHREVSAEDVTDQYVETETRLRNARAMRDRLEQLLARAAVKEAIELERELGRVTGEIESMEGKLKVLRDRIAYSTITVTFEPRGSGAVRDMPLRLPFPWLSTLGLPRLLSLQEGAR